MFRSLSMLRKTVCHAPNSDSSPRSNRLPYLRNLYQTCEHTEISKNRDFKQLLIGKQTNCYGKPYFRWNEQVVSVLTYRRSFRLRT